MSPTKKGIGVVKEYVGVMENDVDKEMENCMEAEFVCYFA